MGGRDVHQWNIAEKEGEERNKQLKLMFKSNDRQLTFAVTVLQVFHYVFLDHSVYSNNEHFIMSREKNKTSKMLCVFMYIVHVCTE